MSTFSGLGSTHEKLVSRWTQILYRITLGSVRGIIHQIIDKKIVHEVVKGPRDVARMSKNTDIVHKRPEQAGMVPRNAKTVVTVHDLFLVIPIRKNNIEVEGSTTSLEEKTPRKK